MPFSLFDLVAHPVFVMEPDEVLRWRCTMLNHAARQALGSDTSGDIEQLLPDRVAKSMVENCEGVRRSGRPLRLEQKLQFGDNMRIVQVSLGPQIGDDGETEFIVGSWTDVTDQRYLRAPNSEDKNSGKEDLIFVAAHDMLDPLRRVSEATDKLRDGFKDLGDGKMDLIDLLESTSTSVLDLIGDVLAHVEAQGSGAPRIQFNLGDVVKKTIRMLDPADTIECACQPIAIICDQTVIHCVLRNLIHTSLRHARDDAQAVHLSITVEAAGDDHLRLLYEDNSSDFDPDELFDMPHSMFGHHGLGLLAMRRVVHNNGGTITAGYGANGRGARVMVALPGQIASMPKQVGSLH